MSKNVNRKEEIKNALATKKLLSPKLDVVFQAIFGEVGNENIEKIVLTEKFEIDILELPKIKDREHDQDKLMDWLLFLENPCSERVIRKMEENNNLKDAVNKLCSLSEDEKMQRIAELREKANG